jgi:glycosyltransferase involved in cell wall biosynthesis
MVDYVPIQYNLSDLKEKIDWLVKNDEKAKQIAENAMSFARRVFSPEFQKRYVREEIERLVTQKPTIGLAIPCYSLHKHHIRKCLDSIEAQTVKPTQVVISCSSTTEIEPIDQTYSFSYRIIPVAEKQNPSQNRNTAASYLDTDIVAFFDVDDVMHPQRIKFVLDCFKKPCDIVLHSFEEGTTFSTPRYSHSNIRHNVLRRAPSGCAVVYDNIPSKIHHAHVTVRREIYEKVKFREQLAFDRMDDAIFCGDVLSLPNIRSAYIENPLSCYISSGLASE